MVQRLHQLGGAALEAYKQCYRDVLRGIVREDFYQIDPTHWADVYARTGEISVPFLDPEGLHNLAAYAESVEPLGKPRYSQERTCYPPGEVALHFGKDDPRSKLVTGVNMTAVGNGQMDSLGGVMQSPVQWIYHSPHLREFLRCVMQSSSLHPYMNDLGVAINIMRPCETKVQTALGFHFDSICSSHKATASADTAGGSSKLRPQGATGVIGITDCLCGGERVVFKTITRSRPDAVKAVVEQYDPQYPDAGIQVMTPDTSSVEQPAVFNEPTAGVLYLFDGGDVLHGVSAVTEGSRIAAVFLFQENSPPDDTADGNESAKFFYGATQNSHKLLSKI